MTRKSKRVSLPSWRFRGFVWLLPVSAVALLTASGSEAQTSYSRGQNIAPAYEGWEQNADGSRNLLFGYMNRNWEEAIDIPIGPENNIEPGGPDQGQPTHFYPRRNRFIFRIRVPKDFQQELVWTLTVHGKTERAYATLRTDFVLDHVSEMAEVGISGRGPEVRANLPPVLEVSGPKSRIAKVGEPLTLVAHVTDDGIPKPAKARSEVTKGNRYEPPRAPGGVSTATGLRFSWFVYRATGKVTFSPEQFKTWEDTRDGANSPWGPHWVTPPPPADGNWTVQATFDEPGTYVLRALAHDGALGVDQDVTINVTP
jgi:hypothetical protein